MRHKKPLSSVCKPVIRLKTLSDIPSGIFISPQQMQRKGLKGFFGYQRERERERKHY